jgi:hypothetical protein
MADDAKGPSLRLARTFIEWRREAEELARLLYGHSLEDLELELIAGWEVGDTPAEFLAGVFSE